MPSAASKGRGTLSPLHESVPVPANAADAGVGPRGRLRYLRESGRLTDKSEHLKLTIGSDLKNLAKIADFVTGAAQHLGLDDEHAFQVQMATDEACANIIEHAYGPGVAGEIHICCALEGEDFVVSIRDQGAPFDPQNVPEPDLTCPLEDRQIGGLGLYFMRKLMDRVDFCCRPGEGNEVRMRKRRSR
jgi:anti-sigma regulatory factor (Ser/Thr protein kinase)